MPLSRRAGDKRVWGGFCCNASGTIAAIDTTGKLSTYGLKNTSQQIAALIVGPDKNTWYASNYGIGKITPAGTSTDHAQGFAVDSIAAGSNGRMWFGNADSPQIYRVKTDGTALSTFTNGISGIPHSLTLGPDGAIYFSEYVPNTGQAALSRITVAGVVTEYTLPYGFNPGGVCVGPDGNVWTVDLTHDQVAQAGHLTAPSAARAPLATCGAAASRLVCRCRSSGLFRPHTRGPKKPAKGLRRSGR